MKIYKYALIITLFIILLYSVSACTKSGGGGEPPQATGDANDSEQSQAQEQTQKPAETEPSQPVTLKFYYPGTLSNELFQANMADPVTKRYPHIQMELISAVAVEELLTVGQDIDLLFLGLNYIKDTLIESKLAYDLTDLAKKHQFDLGSIDSVILDTIKDASEGHLYGLPRNVDFLKMLYNVDVFDKFGQDYPPNGMTWDETYILAQKMTQKEQDVQYRGLWAPPSHLLLYNQLTAPFVDPKTNTAPFETDPKWSMLIRNFDRFYKFSGSEYKAENIHLGYEMFPRGEIAMFVMASSISDPSWLPENWDIAQLPVFKEYPGVGSNVYPSFYGVSSTSKHKDEAFLAIATYLSDEVQLQYARTGEMTSVLTNPQMKNEFGQDSSLLKGKNVGALFPEQFATAAPITAYDNDSFTAIYGETLKLFLGETLDVNTMLRQATELTNQNIKQLMESK